MTKANGDLVAGSVSRYTPFGDWRTEPTAALTDIGYTGHRHNNLADNDLGLVYMQARYYMPELGRFISADTLIPSPTDAQGFNRYAYTHNNPLTYSDPTGHCIFGVDTLICIAVGTALLKAIDYGWTAWDVWQSSRVLSNPNAASGERMMAALNIGMSILFEAVEPDDLLPVGLPLDDVARKLFLRGANEALGEGGEAGLRAFIRDELGDNADAVLGKMDELLGAACSFTADTLVATENGLKPISEVELHEWVLAYNEQTGELGYYPVVALWVHEDPVIIYLTIEGETIITTPEHPFYSDEGQWVAAGVLQPGDEIRSADWDTGTVQSVHFIARPQIMYNLTVATAHTFFVDDKRWLVHNDLCFPLTPSDLGISGRIDEFDATFSLTGGAATIRVDMIDGSIDNPLDVITNAIEFARSQGARTLRLEGTLANPRLLRVLQRRYGFQTVGGNEFLEIVLDP